MTESTDLTPEIEQVGDLMRQQPADVRNMFRYLGVMSLVDEGRAKIVRAQVERGRHYLRIQTKVGEVFWILRPPISMETELRMREEVKAVLEERDD